ncbi:hypothetical protein GF371_00150 [Candidatus Woesearchaeota archaeon]|nr:hypothetical protein [Candidatus Woesearchaeota archaeon]
MAERQNKGLFCALYVYVYYITYMVYASTIYILSLLLIIRVEKNHGGGETMKRATIERIREEEMMLEEDNFDEEYIEDSRENDGITPAEEGFLLGFERAG